jgi:type II secretory pathway component PulK
MKLHPPEKRLADRRENASVLIIVLWVTIGLVSIALYFANSMNYELRAADNRVNGLSAEQAIEGAARYVAYALQNFATNGAVPNNTEFKCEAVPIGDAKFWVLGRDASTPSPTGPAFGLVDEGGKLNLNTVSTNTLQYLPNMTVDFADAILDWRGTNGVTSLDYMSTGYAAKNSPFETVDELRLVYGATPALLLGEDLNRNGVLDANEKDLNSNGQLDPGLLEYTTVYTREPNFHSDGTSLTNVNAVTTMTSQTRIVTFFETFLQAENVGSASTLATKLYQSFSQQGACTGALDFALRCQAAGMSESDFTKLANDVTINTNTYYFNRVNVNTASADVLAALFMGQMGQNVDEQSAESAAQALVTYRQQNPNNLNSVMWIVDALGNNSPILTTLAKGNSVTTRSFQFTADIAAVGPFGRGYRRVKFIFDVSDGTPKIIYRQDLSRLGWALGEKARENLVAKDTQ